MNGQTLGVAHVRHVRHQFQVIYYPASLNGTPLDADTQHPSKATLQVLLGRFMGRVLVRTGPKDPTNIFWLGLEVRRQLGCILCVALGSQCKRLKTNQQLMRGIGTQAGADVAEHLYAGAHDKRGWAKASGVVEAVVRRRRFNHFWKFGAILGPIKSSRIDDYASNCSSVAADPLGSRVDDNVRAMLDGSNKVTTGTECVVNLNVIMRRQFLFFLLTTHHEHS